jgi:hypothetical protein
MPGTRPGMTLKALRKSLTLAPMGLVPGIHAVTGHGGFRNRAHFSAPDCDSTWTCDRTPAWMAGTSLAMTEPLFFYWARFSVASGFAKRPDATLSA